MPDTLDRAAASAGIAVAIDGPASSGKGTVARAVAEQLGYAYVDTGAMYRTVALRAQQRGVPWSDGESLGRLARALDFDFRWDGHTLTVIESGEDLSAAIRAESVGHGASEVSTHGQVRRALVALQRALGARGSVVMDGRDIGTVVLPDAQLKVYLDAALDERARRRHAELVARGIDAQLDQVTAEIAARDAQDSGRAISPLRRADDARVLDTTHLDAEAAAARVVALARERGA